MLQVFFFISLQAMALRHPPTVGRVEPQPDICDSVLIETPNLMGVTTASETQEICHDLQFRNALSKNCLGNDCALITLAKNQKEGLVYSQKGTPGAWLCQKIGGKSLMVFMSSTKSTKSAQEHSKIHICRKNKDLVSADYLLDQMPVIKK